MRISALCRLALALVLVLGACSSKSSSHRTVRVAAASDLAKAFEELGARFQKKTGITPVVDYGSSGLLAKQIDNGAPYALFAAASKQYAEQVVKSGKCDASSQRMYARGRVVVWTPTSVSAPMQLSDLTDERFKRIAIANPEHAPYGVAAKQALEKAGLWSQLEGRIVYGENVQATMQYARSGNADAAIVALSLAVVAEGGSFLAIDPSSHVPLDQQLVVCGTGEEADAARQLVDFISSPDGREVMKRYGFLLPDDALPQKR
jgi:molybdate transport system substrate-binding protein